MVLSEARKGSFRVSAVIAPDGLGQRLSDLGLHVGSPVRVLEDLGEQGLMIGLGDTRLALGRGAAQGVRVVSLDEDERR